jgi:hypothetical protein
MAVISLERARAQNDTPASVISLAKWHEEHAGRNRHRRGHHIETAKSLRALARELAA